MASDDPPIVPPASASSILPPYPELILAAIEELDTNKTGVNKSRISKHMEATLSFVPAAHKTLLSHHLNKMKAAGQLIMLNNNYLKPDPNAPPRRGRGRPPKPKDPSSPEAVVSPSRPRGRPAKPVDPLAPNATPTKTTTPLSGRKRGRPPKFPKTDAAETPRTVTQTVPGTPRGRGRPPKVKPPMAAPVGA